MYQDKCTLVYYSVMLIVGPAFFITLTLTSIEGLVAYAYYYTIGCDPLASQQIKNPNQVGEMCIEMCLFISFEARRSANKAVKTSTLYQISFV